MPRRYTAREMQIIAEHLGWCYDHTRGSHAIFIREGYSHVTIPLHRRELSIGVTGNIIRQMGIDRREFERLATELL
jgi:predicted RNA binding protein YcfA (HicA-like mRNA interferase family)